MIRPTAYCDECGSAKAEGNHWFHAIMIHNTLFMVGPWEVSFEQWPSELAELNRQFNALMKEVDLCSESCAVKAMSKAIGQQGE